MKRIHNKFLMKKAIDKVINGNINSACFFWFYQPNLPKCAERLKKK